MDECLKRFLFDRVERVDLAIAWLEIWLQVNYVIPRAMLGQLFITLFAKDLCKFIEVCGPFLVSSRQVSHLDWLFIRFFLRNLAFGWTPAKLNVPQ